MLRYQPTPHVLVARPYADVLLRTRKVASHLFVACSPKSRFFPPLVAYFAQVTLIPSFCCMFAEITRIPSTHTYTTTPHGAGVYYSHLFHVRRNHAFPTFSCMFAKFTQENMRFHSIFQALQDLHPFSPLQSQNFRKKSVWKISKFCENSANFVQISANVATHFLLRKKLRNLHLFRETP